MLFKKAADHPDLIDKKALASFLKPISKAEPSGKSLRYEQEYYDIQEAKKVEEDLPQGVWTHDLKEANWNKAAVICVGALQAKSKDIQIVIWLTECWFHEYHVYGLCKGLSLLQKILEKFWATFHPYSKNDPEYRVAPLLWFDNEMSKHLTKTIVALPEGDLQKAMTFWDYQSKILISTHTSKSTANKAKKVSTEITSFYDAVTSTSTEFYKSLIDQTFEALETVKKIEDLVAKQYKEFPGILMHLRGRLEKINHFSKNIYQERNPIQKVKNATKTKNKKVTISSPEENKKTLITTMSSPIEKKPLKIVAEFKNREQAYDYLEKIADYLSKVEPHSPTPYLIKRAVNWGNMSLGEVMNELSQQSGDIQQAMRFLGIDRKE